MLIGGPINANVRQQRDRDEMDTILKSILCVMVLCVMVLGVQVGFAQDIEPPIEERYLPFQGTWELVALTGFTAATDSSVPEVFVEVKGNEFEIRGKGVQEDIDFPLEFFIPSDDEDQPYRQMARRGLGDLEEILDVENQIIVFWFVGIYRLEKGVLELRLKYIGQGSEFESYRGAVARNATLPSSFDSDVAKNEVRIVLERVGATRTNDEHSAKKSEDLPVQKRQSSTCSFREHSQRQWRTKRCRR